MGGQVVPALKPLLHGLALTVDILPLVFLSLHSAWWAGCQRPLTTIGCPAGLRSWLPASTTANEGQTPGCQPQGRPPVTVTAVASTAELLCEGAATLDVAAVGAHLLGPVLDPLAQRFDGRAVDTPLCHAELPQVRPCMAGQGFAVLKVKATELAAGLGGCRQRGTAEPGLPGDRHTQMVSNHPASHRDPASGALLGVSVGACGTA